MGHAMHRVRREEKRRSTEEGGGEGREGEEDPGGGGGGNSSGGEDAKGGREVEKHEEKEGGGRVRLKGALLQTYVLSILIRSVMEVRPAVKEQLPFSPKVWLLHPETIGPPPTGGVSQSPVFYVRDLPQPSVCLQGKNRKSFILKRTAQLLHLHFHPRLCVQGQAMSPSCELLRLQANREKCLYCVHAGCLRRLSGPQRAGVAAPGMEALL